MPPREGQRPDRPADPDQSLVERARRGDAEAFGELVGAYQHRVVNFARAMVSDRGDAEDIAQEAFLRAYRGLRGFRGRSSFKTWLYQIVTNTARTTMARRRSRPEQPAGGYDSVAEIAGAEGASDSPEAAVIRRDVIDRALASLPVELREAVVLRDIDGLDYSEIASVAGIPIGTVESRIFRGRARLRQLISGQSPPGREGPAYVRKGHPAAEPGEADHD